MDIHYILVVASVFVIVAYQLGVFSNTQRKIKSFKAIFPKSPNAYDISVEELDSEEGGVVDVSQIQVNTNNETMKSICDALNMYHHRGHRVSQRTLIKNSVTFCALCDEKPSSSYTFSERRKSQRSQFKMLPSERDTDNRNAKQDTQHYMS